MDLILPFKIGGAIELKSFDAGYRGAWFRCKITDMCIRNGHMECQLEYMDYPEENRSWTRLYKVPPKYRRKACKNRELMLRPPFPQWCWDNHIPQHGQKMEVVAVVSSPWKVGDLVDWWHNDCFWTGKIIELLGDDKVKIVCPEKPLGEGGSYDADSEDLRPALDWSLEEGWSAPLSQENGECWYTARLITENPDTGGSSSDEDVDQCYDGKKEVEKCLNGSFDAPKQEIQKCLNGASVTPEKDIEQCYDGNKKVEKCSNGSFDAPKQQIRKCSNGASVAPEEEIEQCYDGNKEVGKCSNGSFDAPKQEIGKCSNGASVAPEKVMDPDVKHPDSTNGRCYMKSQTRSDEEPQKRTSEDPDTSPEAIHSEAQPAPDEIDECCTNSQADYPTSPMANSGQSSQLGTNGQSCLTSCKKLKTSTERASVQSPAPGTVSEALMEVEKLAHKIRRAQDLLQSIDDDAPSSRAPAPCWRFYR